MMSEVVVTDLDEEEEPTMTDLSMRLLRCRRNRVQIFGYGCLDLERDWRLSLVVVERGRGGSLRRDQTKKIGGGEREEQGKIVVVGVVVRWNRIEGWVEY